MGVAEIVPGVGGTTLSLVMGIYDDFINLLYYSSNFLKVVLKFIIRKSTFAEVKTSFYEIDWRFALLILTGAIIGIVLFSNIVTVLMDKYPEYAFGFFFGLILMSISIPFGELTKKTLKEYLIMITTFVIFIILLGLNPLNVGTPSLLVVFIGGFVSISAIALPGISVSFVLLLLGLYDYILGLLKTITSFNFTANDALTIGLFGLGAIIGFVIFAKMLKVGLLKYPNIVLSFSVGLLAASLRILWPFVNYEAESTFTEMEKTLPWLVDSAKLPMIVVSILVGMGIVLILKRFVKPATLDSIE